MSHVKRFEYPAVEGRDTNTFASPSKDMSLLRREEILHLIWHVFFFLCVCLFKVCPPLRKPRSPQLPGGGRQSGLHEVDGWSHSGRLMHTIKIKANLCKDCSPTRTLRRVLQLLFHKALDRRVQNKSSIHDISTIVFAPTFTLMECWDFISVFKELYITAIENTRFWLACGWISIA